jgi:hypothetical protein
MLSALRRRVTARSPHWGHSQLVLYHAQGRSQIGAPTESPPADVIVLLVSYAHGIASRLVAKPVLIKAARKLGVSKS